MALSRAHATGIYNQVFNGLSKQLQNMYKQSSSDYMHYQKAKVPTVQEVFLLLKEGTMELRSAPLSIDAAPYDLNNLFDCAPAMEFAEKRLFTLEAPLDEPKFVTLKHQFDHRRNFRIRVHYESDLDKVYNARKALEETVGRINKATELYHAKEILDVCLKMSI